MEVLAISFLFFFLCFVLPDFDVVGFCIRHSLMNTILDIGHNPSLAFAATVAIRSVGGPSNRGWVVGLGYLEEA